MMVGTDLTGFQKLRQAGDLELPTHWFPVDPIMPSHTPMDELPEETRMLYDYNPEKAKQMLADAGYPNGFTIDYTTIGWPEFMTDGALLKDQWEKIGVTVNLQGFEIAVWSGNARERTYNGAIRQGHCGGCPVTTLPRFTTGHTRNYTDWSDPHFDAMVEELVKEDGSRQAQPDDQGSVDLPAERSDRHSAGGQGAGPLLVAVDSELLRRVLHREHQHVAGGFRLGVDRPEHEEGDGLLIQARI